MLNKLRDKIHKNAVVHGWWEEERSFGDIIALCHSELSEALEEYRDKKPVIYCRKYNPGMGCDTCIENTACSFKSEKPEGIAIELADCIIRILDYCGKEGIDIDMQPASYLAKEYKEFGDFISLCHLYLSKAYEWHTFGYLMGVIVEIQQYCGKEGINVYEAIRVKHEYNKTRPYRHGGKRI